MVRTRSVKPAVVQALLADPCSTQSFSLNSSLWRIVFSPECGRSVISCFFLEKFHYLFMACQDSTKTEKKVTNKCERKPERRTTGQCQCLNVFIYGGEWENPCIIKPLCPRSFREFFSGFSDQRNHTSAGCSENSRNFSVCLRFRCMTRISAEKRLELKTFHEYLNTFRD